MKTIIVVHGIGGGDAKTKSGFSGAFLRKMFSLKLKLTSTLTIGKKLLGRVSTIS